MGMSTCKKALISLCVLAGTCLAGLPLQALAQDQDVNPDGVTDQSLVLEEVLVTATKREESLQDIPISIGVVSGEFVKDFNILDLNDFQSYVPGLQIQFTFGSWAVRIRGLGSGITNLAFDSSVPIFIDGQYCGRGKCMESMFLDLDRVEVARGPQGALFGKSTMAGAVSVITARPTDENYVYGRAGYEFENGGYLGEATVSGPVNDSFRVRLAAKYEYIGGWVHNPYVPYDEPKTDRWAIRGSFEWDVNDNVEVYGKIETGKSDQKGRSNQLVAPGIMSILSTDPDPEYIPNDIRHVSTEYGKEDYYNYDWTIASLIIDAQIGSHTLETLFGYWQYDNDWRLDVDGAPNYILNTNLTDNYEQATAEVRLLSPTGQTLEYILGAWYQNSSLWTNQNSPFSVPLANLFGRILGVPGFLLPPASAGGVGRDSYLPQRDQYAWSVYGQLTWNITDRWRLIGDLRYTKEVQDAIGQSFASTFPDFVNPVHGPKQYFLQPSTYLFYEDRSDHSWDPALRLQFDVTNNIMTYFSYSEGSKAGGVKANDGNLGDILLAECNADPQFCQTYVGQPSITSQDLIDGLTLQQGNLVFDYEPESGKSYEIGIKSTLAGGRANVNLAVYTMDFKNLQTSSYDGTRFIIQNAASASVDGFEFDANFQATENLQFIAGVAYVDAKYDDFPGGQCIIGPDHEPVNPGCTDGSENLKGYRLERVPKWEVDVAAYWDGKLTDNVDLMASATMYYSSDYYVRQDFDPHGRQPSYFKWDARVALGFDERRWQVALTGRNLSNEHTIQHAYEILGDEFQSLSVGRTIMLDVIMTY